MCLLASDYFIINMLASGYFIIDEIQNTTLIKIIFMRDSSNIHEC